ncbi:MAG: shikimate dehydrogenase [Polyangiaceae bacterium]
MKFAVVGHPVAHSKSPALHAAAYRALDLSHTYEAIDVTEDEFPELIKSLKHGDFQGFSVTVPHKLRAFELADQRAGSAVAAGAANTLVRQTDGKIIAHNTDACALSDELVALGLRPGRRALVIGSGGAARAAVVALADCSSITVLARNAEAAKNLNAIRSVDVVTFAAGPQREFDVVVQATSAGMNGADDGEIIAACIDWQRVPKDAIVYDVVYSPRETPFLRAARSASLTAKNGLGMLARQGAAAFELWLGIAAPLDVMLCALDE